MLQVYFFPTRHYLYLLNFWVVHICKLYRYSNVSDPVVVSSMMSGQAGDAIHFVKHVQMMMPNSTIFLYDLGLSEHEFQLVLPYCNSSKFLKMPTTL